MARQWHLINDSPPPGHSGAYNMGVDEALLRAVARGDWPPTLRLYAWSPPCLSLGQGQGLAEVDSERLAALGWGLVRRPSGGRAILHTDELTYSVALPGDHPLVAGDVVESYRRISAALLRALRQLGAQPEAERAETRGVHQGAVCFERPSHYEITVGGRKLIGSAQVRRKEHGGGVLQHGTLPLYGDIARICEALVYADEAERAQARQQVRARAATLYDALGEVVSWEQAAAAVREAFRATFEIEWVETRLDGALAAQAARLEREVYGSAAWTGKRR
ncbi:MAG: lipoate--protein ligase family protein [Chloroflexi bacterium]|nr:lipoate--protein ligase family protein [Chloroflexota bacterium]